MSKTLENQILLPKVPTLLSHIVVPIQYQEYGDGLFTQLAQFSVLFLKTNCTELQRYLARGRCSTLRKGILLISCWVCGKPG